MTTVEERREVARRLRELDYSDLQEGLICAYLDALGIKGYEDWIGIAHRLADLIEPSCDRDALLRLARYMDKDVAETEAHFSNVVSTESVSDYERRICEACGDGVAMKELIVCADKPTRAMERMRVGDVVRCRDCASIKHTTDGRRYCGRWSRIVPLDGYCWRGEAKNGEEAQEG